MINAYVLSQVEPETDQPALVEQLKTMSGVVEAHIVFGKFDIVTKLSANTQDELNNTVLENIRQIPSVVKTQTLLVSQ